jgi:phosphatidylglycerol:prolipoprotein diacylglycerol transferase
MNPRLIDIPSGVEGIGSLTLPSYFAMVTIGFIWGAILLPRWGRRHGIEPRIMIDFVIWLAIWGLLGSRLLHIFADGHFWDYINVCTDPSKVDWKIDARECRSLRGIWDAATQLCHPSQKNCWAWADLTAGGFAFYGGFIAACIFSIFFVRRHNISGPKILDMGGWGIMFGLAWGRMGCFLASCCFGAQTKWAVGTIFPKGSSASRYHWEHGLLNSYRVESLAVHPTQIYEAIAGLAIAIYAYYWVRPRKRFDGQVFCVTSFLYAIARFMLEFLRRDERGGLLGFSTSQLVAIGLAIACVLLWQYFGNRSRNILEGTEPRG